MNNEMEVKVTEKDVDNQYTQDCFHCHQKVGDFHKYDCTYLTRPVTIRMTVEYVSNKIASWDKVAIEDFEKTASFTVHYAAKELGDIDCLIKKTKFEYVGED